MTAAKSHPAGESGSVFVESIIAAAIVAMALGATFQVVGDGARRDRSVDAHRTALLIAESELAAVGSEVPLRTGETSGVAGDLVWRVRVSPYSDGVDDSEAGKVWSVAVSVTPRAGGPALATLDTLRLGPATAGAGA